MSLVGLHVQNISIYFPLVSLQFCKYSIRTNQSSPFLGHYKNDNHINRSFDIIMTHSQPLKCIIPTFKKV